MQSNRFSSAGHVAHDYATIIVSHRRHPQSLFGILAVAIVIITLCKSHLLAQALSCSLSRITANMDSSSSDEPMSSFGQVSSQQPNSTARPKGQPRRQEQLRKPGPLTLAVIVGTPNGRWSAELSGKTNASKKAVMLLSEALGGHLKTYSAEGQLEDRAAALAIVVLEGWRFVLEYASSAQTFALMKASQALHPQRSEMRFIEHNVIASAIFCDDASQLGLQCEAVSSHPQCVVGQRLLETALRASAKVRVVRGHWNGHRVAGVSDCIAAWKQIYGVTDRAVAAWPVWTPLALAMARGKWHGDVTVLYRRQKGGRSTLPPVRPSDRLIREFITSGIPVEVSPPLVKEDIQTDFQVHNRRHGFVCAYSMEHLVNSLRMSRGLKSQDEASAVANAALQFWYPRNWRQLLHDEVRLHGHLVPSKDTLRWARTRLDIASMLARREWYATRFGSTYRYVGFDASPQSPGIEVFATVERVIERPALREWIRTRSPLDVDVRRLPLSMLGHSRAGLADKVQTHVHQVWQDYGPSVEQVRRANLDVRQCLSDMGTEWGISEFADVVAQCTKQDDPTPGQRLFLYPLALRIPGPQHILDNLLKDTLQSLAWWPAWQQQAKVVCQWLHSQGHRDFLQMHLIKKGKLSASRRKSLTAAIERFAKWRWKTLAHVTSDLLRVEDAVVAAMEEFHSPINLGSRDMGIASAFFSATKDPAFWNCASALHLLSQPLISLSKWIRGCDCHEADRRDGKEVNCKWAGCRASSFAVRLGATRQELHDLRNQALSDRHRGLDCTTVIHMFTRMLAVFDLKFSWVTEPPYLIWEALQRNISNIYIYIIL